MSHHYPARHDCPTCDAIADFRVALIGLRIDDDGLHPDSDLGKLDRIAETSFAVIANTADAANPRDLYAHRLAVMTQRLIRLMFHHGPQADALREWLIARAELLHMDAISGHA